MCNHYQNNPDLQATLQTWREFISWSIEPIPDELGSVAHDAWPKRPAAIVRNGDTGARFDIMQWGVPLTLPGKRPDTTITKHITNVRNLTSPFWRSMLSKPERRCLVPFSQFAEPRPNAGREEVWFSVTDAAVAALAGVWRPSEVGNVFAFLTCEPNPLVATIHPKAMPVILFPEDYGRWLDGEDAATLAVPFPSQLMRVD